jgi:hypothetical protein
MVKAELDSRALGGLLGPYMTLGYPFHPQQTVSRGTFVSPIDYHQLGIDWVPYLIEGFNDQNLVREDDLGPINQALYRYIR